MTDGEAPGSALLEFATTGAYPSTANFESNLLPEDCRSARAGISKARDTAKDELCGISRSVAPDVDGWIAQAQQLQVDIQRSKAIARDIVEEAAQAESLRKARDETSRKLGLLDVEVTFNQSVQTSLEHAKNVARSLATGQDALKEGRLSDVLQELVASERALSSLKSLENTTGVELLRERCFRLRHNLEEAASRQWDSHIQAEKDRLAIPAQSDLKDAIGLLSKIGLVNDKLLRLSKDIDKFILTPRLKHRRGDGSSSRLSCSSDECTVSYARSDDSLRSSDLLDDLTFFIDLLNDSLPQELSIHLSELLMPSTVSHVISDWLHESVPTSLDELDDFDKLLKRVHDFSEHLANVGWQGGADLNDWVEQAPKVWLAKRREQSLVAVRDILSDRINQTQEVEHVETQMVSKGDVMAPTNGGGEDDWDAAWEEDESNAAGSADGPRSDPTEDEDASAWDVEVEEPGSPTAHKQQHPNGQDQQPQGEEDAWGWDEPDSPTATTGKPPNATPKVNGNHAPSSRELTLKETYTITLVPDALLSHLTTLITDATTLQSDRYTNSPIQPAAAALYTLPTLLLAGYRALAASFYAPLPSAGGNMYLYNDCMRLCSSLTAYSTTLSSSNPTAHRRAKLDADIETLTSFGRRAYGKEMASQRTILRDLLDGAQGFANSSEQPYARECENAVAMTVDRVKAVGTEWRPILSRSVWLQSLGSLVSCCVDKVLLDVLDLGDIGEADSVQLTKFCTEIGTLSELFTEEKDGEKRDLTALYTPQWLRFQYLGEILESSLADIRYMWQEEGLRLEFEKGEVVELIEALFSDSERRRQAIGEIRRG